MTRHPTQGDLFEWTLQRAPVVVTPPPSAEVIAFPTARWAPAIWRNKIDRTATVLLRKSTEKAKSRYWADCEATLAEQLRRRGAKEFDIGEQCWQFFRAVESALRKSRNGGAA